MIDVMADLETLSTEPDAVVVSIGAVEFDPIAGALGNRFYCIIDLERDDVLGGDVSARTLKWWMCQSDAARAVFNAAPMLTGHEALEAFRVFLLPHQGQTILWGNGSDFDNVVLRSMYKRAGLAAPWQFYNNRCYRTLKNMAPHVKMERVGTHHNALDDAISQANHAIAIYKDFAKLSDMALANVPQVLRP
jgi:exodeoxyribonuclease VIII